MATPQEKLASSLEALKALQDRQGMVVRSADLSRTHRERLVANGFLIEVMRGWYIAASPNDRPGDTTAWYATFWEFVARYLTDRFKNDWCLTPESSLLLHAGNWTVPQQLVIRAPGGGNNPTELMHQTSLYDMRVALPPASDIETENGIRFYSLPAALVAASPAVFEQRATDLRIALAQIRDSSEILSRLLAGGHSVIAGRLAGALRNIGRGRLADDIIATMEKAGYAVRETDPFISRLDFDIPRREVSPAATRIRLLWQKLRSPIVDLFPDSPGTPNDVEAYLERVEDAFITDAYHSLSIEGYRVSPDLIERVRSGDWNPDAIAKDREHQDALAARGYWQAFEAVKKSVRAVLTNATPGDVVEADHSQWYRELFGPSVTAGIIEAADLAGYRSERVFIRNSMHTPLAPRAVSDAMAVFFELLSAEDSPAVRVVLGHFIFVYIHPYMDGNGRMGRFLMNVMLAGGGYPWTVIPVGRRNEYMAALEQASVHENIEPFSRFIAELVQSQLNGEALPAIPEAK
ncbi:Fic family protein [Glycocaulis abyssi]|uniref:Fic family protein n=1 Tax=Glycocaulis abyssi TaxID=1433403 RepID=A0ABV9NFG2_9PROT